MADEKLGDVTLMAEGMRPRIGPDSHSGTANAALFLVCRLFTDAIFSQDIRAIQLIINRVDGGLPKDTEVDSYRTRFSDCLNELMSMERSDQLKVYPEDTVMMALCKALYSLSVQDIYWDDERGDFRHPSTERKQERDAALRMVLESVGGRKTLVSAHGVREEVGDADWISALPGV
jgi:hypothetical protein